MDPVPHLLALRFGEASHALEPDRDYLVGSDVDCDLVIVGAAPRHARLCVTKNSVTIIDLGGPTGVLHNEERVATAKLQPGDRIAIAGEVIVITIDDGNAAFVPIPQMRQAAVERNQGRVRVAATALRRTEEETFADLMSAEMRRAPWVACSLILHSLLLWLLWIFTPTHEVGGQSQAWHGFDLAGGAPIGSGTPAPPPVILEDDDEEILADAELLTQQEHPPLASPLRPIPQQLTENPMLAKRKRPSSLGDGKNVALEEEGSLSGSFQKQVAELQETGLEIVFVFDSTGSMTRTIIDTKSTIVQMLDVLRTLVPDARIGLVTYRDRDRREDYLVRQVPLDIDYWRATNFVQFVEAEGGGDRSEDVRAGLTAAFNQRWRRSARRVVVLAGDAPTHSEDLDPLLKEIRSFTNNRRSFVHALITNPRRAGEDTHRQFTLIAKAGRGACEPISNHDRILQRVLTLAFGRKFQEDIDVVIQSVKKERDRVDVAALHVVRKAGSTLARALKQRPVPTTLWNALIKRPRRPIAECLLDLLADAGTPSHTRHAAAAALQRIFELPVPPIDPQSSEPPSDSRLRHLRRRARQLPE